jgi:hypothetical protein
MDRFLNIHSLQATQEFGDINTANISQAADLDQFGRTNVNLPELQRAVGIWYPARRQIMFSVPLGTGLDNDLRIVGEVRNVAQPDGTSGRLVRFFMSRRDIAIALWLSMATNRPRIGDDEGFVWDLDGEARNKDGEAYGITFQTADTDLGFIDQTLAYKNKNFEFLELVSEPSGEFDLTVEVYVDNVLVDTVVFDLSGGGVALGTFELDTDALGSNFTKTDRQRIVGSGRRIRLVVSNNTVDAAVSIAQFNLAFNVGEESTSRSGT